MADLSWMPALTKWQVPLFVLFLPLLLMPSIVDDIMGDGHWLEPVDYLLWSMRELRCGGRKVPNDFLQHPVQEGRR